jgi:DUF4097 and DUF4098 domain-containing protein YvlB
MRRSKILSSAIGITIVAACPLLGANFEEKFSETHPLNAKGSVEVDNINGGIRVSSWDRNEVKVEAVKKAKIEEHLEQVKIEVAAAPEHIAIKSRYPKSRQNNSTSVEYTITVPRECDLRLVKTINGGIAISGVRGNVQASSINGSVRATGLSGQTQLSTVNGSVKASLIQLARPVSMKTINGSISLALPAGSRADIAGTVTNGRIKSDFPLQPRKQRPVGQEISGKLGEGGPDVKMSTVSGSIHLAETEATEAERK